MKKYLALLIFVFITTLSFGQRNNQDVIYLKDGSIIRGVIIEQASSKTISIETPNKKVFNYEMYEIIKVTNEPFQEEIKSSQNSNGLQSGYKGIVELGYQLDAGNDGVDGLKLNIINGYQINPYFSLGLGTGLRYYYKIETALIPVFADFRVSFLNKKVSPYFSFGIGYTYDLTNNFNKVGWFYDPTVGISFKVSDKLIMNMGLGLEMQNINYSYGAYPQDADAITLNLGISF